MANQEGAKTFLFLPIDAHGHVNAMVALANQLRSLNAKNRTIFLCNDSTTPANFGHELILGSKSEITSSESESATAKVAAKVAQKNESDIFLGDKRLNQKWEQLVDQLDLRVTRQDEPETIVKSLAHNYSLLKFTIEQEILQFDDKLEQLIVQLKPDLVIVDQLCPIPAIYRLANEQYAIKIGLSQPLRWLSLMSANPLPLFHSAAPDIVPPPLMGVSVRHSTRVQCEIEQLRYERALRSSGMIKVLTELAARSLVAVVGVEPDLAEQRLWQFARNQSNWLNVYMFPKELDYHLDGLYLVEGNDDGDGDDEAKKTILRVDSLIRAPSSNGLLQLKQQQQQQDSPMAQLVEWRATDPSAIIVYVSLGTTISSNVRLMSKLLKQVDQCLRERSSWRFVVALGSRSELLVEQEQQLLRNNNSRLLVSSWWPQPELFAHRLVSACVTHGGNNTLCELFHFGLAPHIVCVPAFHDQLDNARRLEDMRMGVALPAACLLEANDDGHLLRNALDSALQLVATTNERPKSSSNNNNNNNSENDGQDERRDALYCARQIVAKLDA